jgi:hypothetical protein
MPLTFLAPTLGLSLVAYSFAVIGTNLSRLVGLSTSSLQLFPIPCIVSSAGEAKYAALFAESRHAASFRTILSDLS